VWSHISSLNGYPFTNTASRMLNIFYTKGSTNARKRSMIKRHMENMFMRRINQAEIM